MAVWINIIGFRKLESIKEEKVKIQNIISKFEIVKEYNLIENKFECIIDKQLVNIHFDEPNFIYFSGSFDLFAYWFKFVDRDNSEIVNKIRDFFRLFALEYEISELFYFSEWFYEIEENDLEFLNARIKDKNLKNDKFYNLNSNEFYCEEININTDR